MVKDKYTVKFLDHKDCIIVRPDDCDMWVIEECSTLCWRDDYELTGEIDFLTLELDRMASYNTTIFIFIKSGLHFLFFPIDVILHPARSILEGNTIGTDKTQVPNFDAQ